MRGNMEYEREYVREYEKEYENIKNSEARRGSHHQSSEAGTTAVADASVREASELTKY
jgi:hypothetical protein